MEDVFGPDYSWRLDVYKRLNMPVASTVLQRERRRQSNRRKDRLRKLKDREEGKLIMYAHVITNSTTYPITVLQVRRAGPNTKSIIHNNSESGIPR